MIEPKMYGQLAAFGSGTTKRKGKAIRAGAGDDRRGVEQHVAAAFDHRVPRRVQQRCEQHREGDLQAQSAGLKAQGSRREHGVGGGVRKVQRLGDRFVRDFARGDVKSFLQVSVF